MKYLKIKEYKNLVFFSSFFLFCFCFCSPKAMAISITQEKKLAKKFMKAIKEQKTIIKDPISTNFIKNIGAKIVAHIEPQPFDFSFNIVDDNNFNAFAGPGANIFINTGVITSVDNVNELAGIISHEIGHSTCRHVSQMIDRSKKVQIGTIAGVLAGVLLGSKGNKGSENIAQGMIISSMAAGQTTMLSFSRENEEEADQKGLSYVTAASFSPKGLLTALKKMRSIDWYGTDNVPGYLKTHPHLKDRIIYIETWLADNYMKSNSSNNINPMKINLAKIDSIKFNMVKYRLQGLYKKKDTAQKKFAELLKKNPDNPGAHYGMALVLERKSMFKQALFHLEQAILLKPFNPFILFEISKIHIHLGNTKKALNILEKLDNIPEISLQISYYKALAKLELGMFDKAKKDFLKIIKKSSSSFPKAYYYIAKILKNNGKNGLSHYYLGLYYYEIKNIKNGCFHFKKSLKLLNDLEKIKKVNKLLKKCKK